MNRMALTSPLATLTVVIVVSALGACGQSSSSQAPVRTHDNSSGFVPDTKPLPAVKWLDATVPEGTVVNLSMIDSLSSGSTRKGDPFRTLVTDAILINGVVAIPSGCVAGRHWPVAFAPRYLRKMDESILFGMAENLADGQIATTFEGK